MSKIKDILKTLLFTNNLTPTELARRVDLPQQTIQRITQGTSTNPRAKTIEKLASHFDISSEQLLGKAPLFIEGQQNLGTPSTQHIPLFTFEQLYTTHGTTLPATPTDQIMVSHEYDANTFAVIMNDASMVPYFDKGCILIIEPKEILEDRDFALIRNDANDNIIFRQAIQEGKDFYLKALNPESPSFQARHIAHDDHLLGILVETRQVFSRRAKELYHA